MGTVYADWHCGIEYGVRKLNPVYGYYGNTIHSPYSWLREACSAYVLTFVELKGTS